MQSQLLPGNKNFKRCLKKEKINGLFILLFIGSTGGMSLILDIFFTYNSNVAVFLFCQLITKFRCFTNSQYIKKNEGQMIICLYLLDFTLIYQNGLYTTHTHAIRKPKMVSFAHRIITLSAPYAKHTDIIFFSIS